MSEDAVLIEKPRSSEFGHRTSKYFISLWILNQSTNTYKDYYTIIMGNHNYPEKAIKLM